MYDNQNDYIILFDENGSPYIEHGLIDSVKSMAQNVGNSIKKRVTKYVAKVKDYYGPGKSLYFYTQEAYQAFLRGGRKTKKGIQNALGADEKEAMQSANRKSEFDKTRYDRYSKAYGEALAAGNTARAAEIKKVMTDQGLWDKSVASRDKASAAQEAYDKTLMGRADKLKSSASNSVTNAKNRFERMKDDIREKTGSAIDSVKGIKNNIGTTQKKDLESANSKSEFDKKRYDRYSQAYGEALAEGNTTRAAEIKKVMTDQGLWDKSVVSKDKANAAQEAYDNTLMGRADKALSDVKNKISGATSSAKDSASNAANSIKTAASNTANSVKTTASNASNKVNDTIQDMIDTARTAKNNIGTTQKKDLESANSKSEFDKKRYDRYSKAYGEALAAGNTARAAEIKKVMTDQGLWDKSVASKDKANAAQEAYDNTYLGRADKAVNNAKQLTSNEAQKLLEKLQSGATLPKDQFNALMAYMGGIFNK